LSPPLFDPVGVDGEYVGMAIFLKEYAHTHTHFRAAGCSQLNGSTVFKERIEYVRLGLVVLLLLFAVSWLPAGFTCQGSNVDYLLTSRRLCSNRDYGMDGTVSHTRQTQKHHLQTKRCKATSLHWTALYFGREMNQTQQQCIIIDLAILCGNETNTILKK
jgi:hypothetical protein